MTITLPLENQRWPKFRLLTRASWGGTTASGGGWQTQVMQSPSPKASGLILLNYSRALLPQLGTAEIMFRYGKIGDRVFGASAESSASLQQGNQWDPSSDTMGEIPDLTGKELRIQAGYPDENGDVAANEWATVFWGTCEYQRDETWGASPIPSGDRIYSLIDAFARTQRWFLNRHGYTDGSTVLAPINSHPGYNVSPSHPAQVAGNMGPEGLTWQPSSGIYARCNTMPGAGSPWTDALAATNALAIARPENQPVWTLAYESGAAGAPATLESSSAWMIQPNESLFSYVGRVFNRSRGRGAALPTWTELSPTGPLTCQLKVFAQLAADISYTDPTGGTISIDGAIADGTSVIVDLIGDHRFVPDSLKLGDAEQYRVDYLVSEGEPIEVLATLEYTTTLEKGWQDAEATTFKDLDLDKRIRDRWRPVYQLHRLKRTFQMQVGNGNGGATVSADFCCADDGTVISATSTSGYSALSGLTVLDDLPLYDGYNYTAAPVRFDGQTTQAFGGTPARKPIIALIKRADDRFLRLEEMDFSIQLKVTADGLLLECAKDSGTGARTIGDTDIADLSSLEDYDTLVFTVGIRLPHRVRLASGTPTGARRIYIPHPDLHLWLAASNAIWDIDDENRNSDGSQPKRGAATSVKGALRDDRSALARMHYLACTWYGVDQSLLGSDHRNASWAMRCCGDIPSSADYDGGGVVYPTCGQVVQYLYANGERITLNTVVSSFTYDNTNGVSAWTTDWADLDVANG